MRLTRQALSIAIQAGNVMLTPGGVKLLDFGLAKLRDPEPDPNLPASTQSGLSTEDGAVLGTYPYMAPEQISGGHVDGRADIFALGVVMHEMASGVRPFDAPTRAGVAAAILTRTPPLLSSLFQQCHRRSIVLWTMPGQGSGSALADGA